MRTLFGVFNDLSVNFLILFTLIVDEIQVTLFLDLLEIVSGIFQHFTLNLSAKIT